MSERTQYKAYGIWNVTADGGTTRSLGTYRGFIDEIALALADKCYGSLVFHQVQPDEMLGKNPTAAEVNVTLGIDSGTWYMSCAERADFARKLLAGRPVVVKEGTQYASFIIAVPDPTVVAKQKALDKLTAEERKLLGLE